MAWGDGFYRKARAKVKERTGEDVEVIGWAARTGAVKAVIAGAALRGAETAMDSPIVAGAKAPTRRMRAGDAGKDVRLPMNFIVALTPAAMHVFKVRRTWTGLKLKRELGRIPRAGLRLEMRDAGIATRFRLDGADGSSLAFEMNKCSFTASFANDLRVSLGN